MLLVLIVGGSAVAAAPPPGHGSKPHQGITVGIAYAHGDLVLSSAKAGRARIVMRSADGLHKLLKTVTLQTPTTVFQLRTLFPKIMKGRYRIVVSPRFKDGYLSGAWITVR
jgi:hypothetical protein